MWIILSEGNINVNTANEMCLLELITESSTHLIVFLQVPHHLAIIYDP